MVKFKIYFSLFDLTIWNMMHVMGYYFSNVNGIKRKKLVGRKVTLFVVPEVIIQRG